MPNHYTAKTMRGLSPNWLLGTETLHLYIRRRQYDGNIDHRSDFTGGSRVGSAQCDTKQKEWKIAAVRRRLQ